MSRADFFRRLGLAVAALFAPKVVEGSTLRVVPSEDFTVVFKDCRIEGTNTFVLPPRTYVTGDLIVPPNVTIIGA